MDVLWIVLGIILMVVGLAGCILPFLPGPPLCYLALLIQQLQSTPPYTTKFLLIWAAITLVVTGLDYVIPIYGTKKFGGDEIRDVGLRGRVGCGFVAWTFRVDPRPVCGCIRRRAYWQRHIGNRVQGCRGILHRVSHRYIAEADRLFCDGMVFCGGFLTLLRARKTAGALILGEYLLYLRLNIKSCYHEKNSCAY